jgi:hypothetical protein
VKKTNSSSAFRSLRESSWQIVLLVFIFCGMARAQTATTYQRVISRPVAEVRAAMQRVSATTKGRLPTLEGFVEDQAKPPLDRYDKGYYECTFDVAPAVGGGTLVVATAKITAFLNDPTTGASGYRVLASNGRLENDSLDRIEETLNPVAAAGGVAATSSANDASRATAAAPSQEATPPPPPNRGDQPSKHLNLAGGGYAGPATSSSSNSSPAGESSSVDSSSSTVTTSPRVPVAPTAPLPSGETTESLKALRAAGEKKSQELADYIKNLEEIQRNQARPADLAAVKKPKTPVFAKPSESAPVLLNADEQDEFEVLQVEGAWVHVQISGASRGWIRRLQLEMPPGYTQAANNEVETPAGAAVFKVAKEETSPFSGKWEQLEGKTVRIEWVEPSPVTATSSPDEKLAFAKSVFLKAYESLNAAHQNVAGIVVVFDSADGGQIAAGLSSVKGLADKTLNESSFWRQCSLDPPESFRIFGK